MHGLGPALVAVVCGVAHFGGVCDHADLHIFHINILGIITRAVVTAFQDSGLHGSSQFRTHPSKSLQMPDRACSQRGGTLTLIGIDMFSGSGNHKLHGADTTNWLSIQCVIIFSPQAAILICGRKNTVLWRMQWLIKAPYCAPCV